jgi:SAM-dependent methyltransferase
MKADQTRTGNLEDRGGNLRFLQAMVAEVPLAHDSKILEIGCGTGALGMFLGAATGAEVYGTERSPELAAIASTRIHCLLCPDGNIPETLDPFDLIYCKDIMMMVDDKRRFYRSVRSHLRDGGTFCTYLPEESDHQRKPLFNFIPCGLETSRLSYGSLEENLKLLKECGFERTSTRRLFLGSVEMNESYARRHWDGYFSNSDLHVYEGERASGLGKLIDILNELEDFGILASYEWERTMVIAR